MHRRRPTIPLLVSALVLVAGACGSGSKASSTTSSAPGPTTTTSAPGTGSTTPVSSSATTRPPSTTALPGPSTTAPMATTSSADAHETVVSEADTGRTLTLHRGDIVTVVLHSTYWQFGAPSNGAVVTPDGSPSYAPMGRGCVAGQGCGTATARFRVVGTGRSTISASRTVCGEAMACAADQQHWSISVDVAALG